MIFGPYYAGTHMLNEITWKRIWGLFRDLGGKGL